MIIIEQQMVSGGPGGQYSLPAYANNMDTYHGPNWLHDLQAHFLRLDGSVKKYKKGTRFSNQYVAE
jgi:hypothetical protein